MLQPYPEPLPLFLELGRVLIKRGEGRRNLAYDDLTGKTLRPGMQLRGQVTVGWGRNLTDKGLSDAECDLLLGYDLIDAHEAAVAFVGEETWSKLDPVRKAVLIDMGHNLGADRLGRFHAFRAAIQAQDWLAAEQSMKQSLWHRQVGGRALHLEHMMRTGEDRTWQARLV